jgi:hypothetical protein
MPMQCECQSGYASIYNSIITRYTCRYWLNYIFRAKTTWIVCWRKLISISEWRNEWIYIMCETSTANNNKHLSSFHVLPLMCCSAVKIWGIYIQEYKILFQNHCQMIMYSRQWRSQPENLVPLCKFKIIIIIHFFRNWLFPQ